MDPIFGLETILDDRDLVKSILDSLPIGVFILDEDTELVEANPFFSRLMKRDANDLFGLRGGGNILGCARRHDAPQGCGHGPFCGNCKLRGCVMDTMLRNTSHQRVEMEMVWEVEGTEVRKHLLLSTAPMVLRDRGRRILVAIEDVTEVRQREKEIADQRVAHEQLKVVAEMAGTVAHEVSQPLQAIKGYAEFAITKFGPEEDLGKMLTTIRTNADRITDLIRKMQNIRFYHPRPYANGVSIVDIDRSSEGGRG